MTDDKIPLGVYFGVFTQEGISDFGLLKPDSLNLDDKEVTRAIHIKSTLLASDISNRTDIAGPLTFIDKTTLNAVVYRFPIVDITIKDERVQRDHGRTFAFLFFIYDATYPRLDEGMGAIRLQLKQDFDDWKNAKIDVTDISNTDLEFLTSIIIEKLRNIRLYGDLRGLETNQLAAIRYLEHLASSSKKHIRILVLSDTIDYVMFMERMLMSSVGCDKIHSFYRAGDHTLKFTFQDKYKKPKIDIDICLFEDSPKFTRIFKKYNAFIFFIESYNNTMHYVDSLLKNTNQKQENLILFYNQTTGEIDLDTFGKSPVFDVISSYVFKQRSIPYAILSKKDKNTELELCRFFRELSERLNKNRGYFN